MALSDADRAVAETHLGASFNEADVEARLARTGDIYLAVREVIERQLATFRMQPDSITIPGEYAQTIGGSRAALEAALAELPTLPGSPGGVRVVQADMSRWRR